MTNKEFFSQFAIECGITDIKYARQVYYALVRTLYKGLKEGNRVEMPDWGVYKIKPHAARNIYDINNGGIKHIPAINTLRFEVDHKLKEKIKML